MPISVVDDYCESDEGLYKVRGASRGLRDPWETELAKLRVYEPGRRRREWTGFFKELPEREIRQAATRETSPALEQSAAEYVLEEIKKAPVAYFEFFSSIGFVLFAFSLAFYYVFDTILVNPVFAVFGGLACLFSWLLARISGRLWVRT